VRWAVETAAKDASCTASYRLSHRLMLLLVERASQLQPLKQPLLASLLARQGQQQLESQLRQEQIQLLQQAEEAGQAALQLFEAQKQRLLDQAASVDEQVSILGFTNEGITAVQELLQKLPQIRNELTAAGGVDAAEVAAVLAALMQVGLLCVSQTPVKRQPELGNLHKLAAPECCFRLIQRLPTDDLCWVRCCVLRCRLGCGCTLLFTCTG
jgi:hypothetical protein